MVAWSFTAGPVAAAQHRDQQLERGLEAAGRPARLLPAVGVDRHGQLLGHDQVLEVGRPPAAQLRAVAEVQVLGQRVARSSRPTSSIAARRQTPAVPVKLVK